MQTHGKHGRRRWTVRGQAMVEFAIILPVVFLILVGIIAFGMVYSHQLILNNASREGARAGATCSTDAQIDAIVRARAVGLANRNDPTILKVTITPPQGDPSRIKGNPLDVKLTYKDNVPFVIPGIFSKPEILTSETIMRLECP